MEFKSINLNAEEKEFISQFEYPDLEVLDQDFRWCHKYCHDILTEKFPSCLKMKWTALRHFRDLNNPDFYFDEAAAVEVVRWFSLCPITKGPQSGQPMILDPSQIFIVVSLMSWMWSDDKFEVIEGLEEFGEVQVRWKGKRRYNQAYLQLARKFGKTALMAGLTLLVMKKRKYSPNAFSLATKRDQAKIVWEMAKKMINLSSILKQHFENFAHHIALPATEGKFTPLASDSDSLDGLDPDIVILDECHAVKDPNLYGVMISAFGGNVGGDFLMSVITTAGTILTGLCVDLYQNGSLTLDPSKSDVQENYFYAIFEIDEGDDWTLEQNWFKSNPALIYGRPNLNYIRQQAKAAKMKLTEKINFLTKHCNLFVNGFDKWLNSDDVLKNEISRKELDQLTEKYIHEKRPCWAGVDRAKANDVCAFTKLFADDNGGITIKIDALIGVRAYEEAPAILKTVYDESIASGELTIVDNETVRDSDVEKMMINDFETYNLEGYFYDPWHMREICERLEEKDYNTVAVSQGTGNMSEPSKKLEQLIIDKVVRYNSILFKYACSCAMVKVTSKNNQEVFRDPKNFMQDKIDVLIATIISLSAATLMKQDKNIYEERGVISIDT